MNSLEQAEDLKAFERRLTEYVSCLQPATGRWRMILIVVSVCTATGAWNWLIDPDTQKVSFFSSLWNHPFFTISCVTLIGLFFAGIHKRVVAPSILYVGLVLPCPAFCLSTVVTRTQRSCFTCQLLVQNGVCFLPVMGSTMDLKEYFKRIGFTGLYDKADLPTLCTIHKLHVMTIPFENLSIHCGEKITMDLKVIYKKIVLDHRGGWCCENNLLFSWVLREMGYKFTRLGARVFNVLKNDFNPMDSHLINLVEIDGKPYIADVSYGVSCQIWQPLEMIAGKDQPQPPGVFRLLNDGERWILEKTGRKPLIQNEAMVTCSLVDKRQTKTIYSFFLIQRDAGHFLNTIEYLQTSCESLFTQKSICSLQTATGFRALIGWTYSEVTFKPQDDTDIMDIRDIPDSEIETVLKEKFKITLHNKLTPINNKASYKI